MSTKSSYELINASDSPHRIPELRTRFPRGTQIRVSGDFFLEAAHLRGELDHIRGLNRNDCPFYAGQWTPNTLIYLSPAAVAWLHGFDQSMERTTHNESP